MAEPVDWPGLMRLGIGSLHLAPDVFWAMTPVEFCRALEGVGLKPVGGVLPMARTALEQMMAAHPDAPRGEE